jgi:hypothetical protein
MERSERSTSARDTLLAYRHSLATCRLKWTAPASRTQCIFLKLLIFLDVAGDSVTFCSRSFHPIRCDFVAAFSRGERWSLRPRLPRKRVPLEPRCTGDGSQVLFGEFAKLVGNGMGDAQRHRVVSNCIPSEAIADLIDGTVGPPNVPCLFWCRGDGVHLEVQAGAPAPDPSASQGATPRSPAARLFSHRGVLPSPIVEL